MEVVYIQMMPPQDNLLNFVINHFSLNNNTLKVNKFVTLYVLTMRKVVIILPILNHKTNKTIILQKKMEAIVSILKNVKK